MRARFVGDPRFGGEGPETLNWLGVSFTKGKWAPVSAEIGARLSNNSHFEVEPFNGADPELFDHDGDGAAGGSLPVDAAAEAWVEQNWPEPKRGPGRPKKAR